MSFKAERNHLRRTESKVCTGDREEMISF